MSAPGDVVSDESGTVRSGDVADPRARHALPPRLSRLLGSLPRPLRAPVELLARMVLDAVDDRVVGLSAEVAFFAILSLPPLLLTMVAALGFVPGDQTSAFVSALVRASTRVFTQGTVDDLIAPTLRSLVDTPRGDVISVGFAVSVLSASRAVRVVLTAVAIAYDLERYRPNWRQRVWALLITLSLFVVVPVVVPLLLAGPDFGRWLEANAAVPDTVVQLWPYAYWGIVGAVGVLGIAIIYNVAAPAWTPFRRDVPGALLAIAVGVASSAGLRVYTRNALADNDVYGILAGPLALLVWLYLLAFGVLLGAELNAELERMYPSPEHLRAAPRLGRRRRRAPVVGPIDADEPSGAG